MRVCYGFSEQFPPTWAFLHRTACWQLALVLAAKGRQSGLRRRLVYVLLISVVVGDVACELAACSAAATSEYL